MSEILFLGHRIPFPPDRGDKIRSHHLLKALARIAPVHVACFMDDDADAAEEPNLAAVATSHCLVRRTRPVPLAALEAVATGRPVCLPAFFAPRIARYVAARLRDRPISTLFVFSVQMAQYIPADFRGRVVMDFVDVDSAKFEAYAATSRQPFRAMYAREARLLSRFESQVARRAAASLLVTPEEAALFVQRMGEGDPAQVLAIGNGIDSAFFAPGARPAEPAMVEGGPQIAFTGQMDYPPNVAAVEQFTNEVMPGILAVHPQARFHIVGREPAPAVRALEGRYGTRVQGRVPDVRPWLAGADLVVAPLMIARGVQNKVLEAMAMARPVLVTPAAATGIPATAGEHFAVADGAAELTASALGLLGDPARAEKMGAAARRFVMERCGWEAMLSKLPRLIGLDRREQRNAA